MSAPPMTVSKTDPRIDILRRMFRNLLAWRAVYETEGIDTLTAPDGSVWTLWDLEKLYSVAVHSELLPRRARQSIELFLVLNKKETEVAQMMSIQESNPIGMYSTTGLRRLLAEIDKGTVVNPWAVDNG